MYKSAYTARNDDRLFTGEKEIYDFVYEHLKRRIAAKRENILKMDIEIEGLQMFSKCNTISVVFFKKSGIIKVQRRRFYEGY